MFTLDSAREREVVVELRNTQPGHNKFYTIQLTPEGRVNTTYGAIGCNKPQSQMQTFGALELAVKHANKVFNEKTSPRKGYAVVSSGGAGVCAEKAENLNAVAGKRKLDAPDFGVMLAESFNKSMYPRVMGWVVSEKYDGVRSLWYSGSLWTRNGNLIHAPSWFTADLPPAITLDGELWIGRGRFNEVSGLVRSLKSDDDRWRSVVFKVFDAPKSPGGLLERLKGFTDTAYAQRVQYDSFQCEAELQALYDRIVDGGGEGLILRNPSSKYEHKRSHNMLKFKEMKETEATVCGYNFPGKTSIRCTIDDTNVFSVTVTAAVEANPPPIGALVTIQYFSITNGVPRFPVYKGVRSDIPDDEVIVIE
jgi:DNA ligase-1